MIEIFTKKEKLPEFYTITEKEGSDIVEGDLNFKFKVVGSDNVLFGEVKSIEDGKTLIATILKAKGLDVSVVEIGNKFYPKDKDRVKV